jgi:hypothetical protein
MLGRVRRVVLVADGVGATEIAVKLPKMITVVGISTMDIPTTDMCS